MKSWFSGFFLVIFSGFIFISFLYAQERYILVDKATYTLYLFNQGNIIFEAKIGYGLKSPLFKSKKGDFLTPEGAYKVTTIRPSTQYYYFLELNYPNFNDLSLAYFRGEVKLEFIERYLQKNYPQRENLLGSNIGIHGGGAFKKEKGEQNYHWTQGCIALHNADLDYILRYIKTGDSVYIIHSQKSLFEILKKLAYPLRVRPLDFWEGALYLKVNPSTFWYFKIIETYRGKKLLLWEEWIKGRLNAKAYSEPDGALNPQLEKTLKDIFIGNINSLLEPFQGEPLSQWK